MRWRGTPPSFAMYPNQPASVTKDSQEHELFLTESYKMSLCQSHPNKGSFIMLHFFSHKSHRFLKTFWSFLESFFEKFPESQAMQLVCSFVSHVMMHFTSHILIKMHGEGVKKNRNTENIRNPIYYGHFQSRHASLVSSFDQSQLGFDCEDQVAVSQAQSQRPA